MTPAFDKGIVFAGQSQSGFVVKIDSVGNVQWGKTYLLAGNNITIDKICRTTDSAYCVAGISVQDVICMKLRRDGSAIWAKKITGGNFVSSIIQTKDRGFVITGSDGSAVVTKLDSLGNFQWRDRIKTGNFQNNGATTKQLPDSSLVVLAYRHDSSPGSMGYSTIINLDKTGNFNWAKSYNKSAQIYNWPMEMEITDDGIVIFMNLSSSTLQYGLLKTDLVGNVVWCKTYSGGGGTANLDFKTFKRTKDKGFIFGQDRIIKTDSIGMPQWINVISGPSTREIVECWNGTIASAAFFYGSLSPSETHLIVMDSLGNNAACTQTAPLAVYFEGWLATSVTPTITTGTSAGPVSVTASSISVISYSGCPISGVVERQNAAKERVEIYPNPSNGIFEIRMNGIQNATFTLNDISGKQIAKGSCDNETKIDISREANGIYFLKIKDANGNTIDTRKLIKK